MKPNSGKIGPALVILLSLLPLVFWYQYASFSSTASVFRSLGQATALVGFCLYAFNTILSSRLRFLESLFFGINKAYIFHHLMGGISFALLLVHPVALVVADAYISLTYALGKLIPNPYDPAVLFGSLSLTITIILLIFTFWLKLEYDAWKKIHRFFSLGLFFACLHIFLIGSTFDYSPILRVYVFTLAGVALVLQVYRLLVPGRLRGQARFYLHRISKLSSDYISLDLTPCLSRPLKFIPGQYIFIQPQKPGLLGESHPFSIASDRKSGHLNLIAKVVGGFTGALSQLRPGDAIDIEGPFGKFTPEIFDRKNQIWIAGGIGITPFLSCARSMQAAEKNRITFFHLVRDGSQAVFSSEIRSLFKNKKHLHFIEYISSFNKRFSVRDLRKYVPDFTVAEIFICGPTGLMTSLKSELISAGVPESHIHTEEFSLAT